MNYSRVSIIIPYYKNKNNLIRCVDKCTELDYPDYEIIVISTVESFIKHRKLKWLVVNNESQGYKRNAGIVEATGELCAFIDDDAYPKKEWLRNAIKYFSSDEIGAVCGPGVALPDEDFKEKASSIILASPFGTGPARYRYTPTKKKIIRGVSPGYNLIIRRSILDEIGGFDVGIRAAEDSLLSDAIRSHDRKILYAPDVVVYHQRRRIFLPLFRQLYTYALHRGYFYKKGKMQDPLFLLPLIVVVSVLIMLIGVFLNVPFFLNVFPIFIKLFITSLMLVSLSGLFISRDLIITLLVTVTIPLVHVVYALGCLRGMLLREIGEISSY